MADIYFPSDLIISNMSINHNTPNFYNESINMVGSSQDRGIHRLEGSFDVSIISERHQKAFEGFLLKVRGKLKPFYLTLARGRFTSSEVLSTPTLNGSHGIGENILSLKAFSGNIRSGDMFTILNEDKVYIALDDRTGAGDVEIYPPIRKTFVDSTPLNFINFKILMRLSSDIQSIDYEESGLIHTATINFQEAL